jgi:hypothetical protein
MGISPGNFIAYSVVKTRATLQKHARSPFRSKKRLPKQKPDRISRSRFYILLLCYSPYIPEYVGNQPTASVASANHSQASWPSFHYHHHCHLLIPEASSHKGTSMPNSSATSGRSPKLVQSIALYRNRSIYTEEYPTFDVLLSFYAILFFM